MKKFSQDKNNSKHDQMVKTISLTLSTVLDIVSIPMSAKSFWPKTRPDLRPHPKNRTLKNVDLENQCNF